MRPFECLKIARGFCIALACVLGGSVQHTFAADEMSDSTLMLASRLLQRSVQAVKTSPIKDNAEAGEVLMALRSTRDGGVLPIFQRIRQSKPEENQIFAMVASAILAKDAGLEPAAGTALDLKALFAGKDPVLQTSALGSLINAKAISETQLKEVLATAPEAIQKAMAAGELSVMGKLDQRAGQLELLKSDKPIVQYETALTMLDGKQPADEGAALDTLKKLSAQHDRRMAQVEALMFERMQKENIKRALPWAAQVAADEADDIGLRYSAVVVLLGFQAAEGPTILADMIQKQKDGIDQVKLGLIAVEYGSLIKKGTLAPLIASKSSLARSIAKIAEKSVDKADITGDLLELLKEGHPIVLDWAYQYSARATPELRLALRTALVNQATIVDNVRDRDYERAALSAEQILEEDGPAGRKVVASLLISDNRAVVDATLSGIYRSSVRDQADVVLQIWGGLTKATSAENAANYAALILAREGRKEAVTWLPGMVVGGTAQGAGFRALAGWYYAKLNGQTDTLLKAALAE